MALMLQSICVHTLLVSGGSYKSHISVQTAEHYRVQEADELLIVSSGLNTW